VAGKHDTDGVRSVRGADGAGRGRDAQSGRLAAISCGGPEGNIRQRAPGRDLKARPLEIERDAERGQLSGEVRIELPGRGLQDRMVRIALGSPADSRAFQGRLR